MKLLSVAIPCYNSAAYMRKCIDSILVGGDRVEILIIDDGSQKDDTLAIAREYEERYPGICRAIHQENGGHGEAVNTGLKNAEGIYFKVVDSDDWLDRKVFLSVLDRLEEFTEKEKELDLFICNFVYDKVGLELMMGHDYLLVNLYIDVIGCTFSFFLCSPYLKVFYNISGIYSSKAVLPYRF